jgi:hypothetical protein
MRRIKRKLNQRKKVRETYDASPILVFILYI